MDERRAPQVTEASVASERLDVPAPGQLEPDALVECVCVGAPYVGRHEKPRAPPTPCGVDGPVDELPADALPARTLCDDEGGDQPDVRVVVEGGEAVHGEHADDVGVVAG